jgi:hypothetical protein
MALVTIGAKIIGAKLLEKKIQKAFETWARFEVNDYFRDQFTTPKWDYPGVTVRKNKDTVGPEPRDIFDLGNLYKSGRDSFVITEGFDDVTASWDWDARNSSGGLYAYYVHEGSIKAGNNLRPRQWTDVLVDRDLFLSSNLSKSLEARIKTAFRR